MQNDDDPIYDEEAQSPRDVIQCRDDEEAELLRACLRSSWVKEDDRYLPKSISKVEVRIGFQSAIRRVEVEEEAILFCCRWTEDVSAVDQAFREFVREVVYPIKQMQGRSVRDAMESGSALWEFCYSFRLVEVDSDRLLVGLLCNAEFLFSNTLVIYVDDDGKWTVSEYIY